MEPERLTIQEQVDLLHAWVQANSDNQLPADGAEPDRSEQYERARRAALARERLEGAPGGGEAIERP